MQSLRACRFSRAHLVFLILCLAVFGCSGDDGDAGPQGATGPAGADGLDSMLYVVYTSPGANETGVHENAAISVLFNREVDTSSIVVGTTFYVRDPVDVNVSGSIDWDINNRMFTFTPSSDLSVDGTYRVFITRDTADADGNTMGYDYIFYFSVVEIGWGLDLLIEESDEDATHPQIAKDGQGNAIAVWQQDDGTRTNIWARRYSNFGGWGTPQLIETDNVGDAGPPQIAMDNEGNAIVVWERLDNATHYQSIMYNTYRDDFGWTGAGYIVSVISANLNAYDPQIAIDEEGNGMVLWKQGDGTGSYYHIWSRACQSGGSWSAASRIEPGDGGNSSDPQIAFDALGNAVVVWWRDAMAAGINIYANLYTAGTGWGTAELIETETGNTDQPQISVDPNGNAIAVWRQNDGARTNIWANIYTAGTGWSTAELIENNNDGSAAYPQIAVDADGNAIAVWEQLDASSYTDIWSNRYTIGTGWGTAELVETATGNNYMAIRPQIAVDSQGNTIAVWKQGDGTGSYYHIWSNIFTAGHGWGTAECIEPGDAGNSSDPQIAIDSEDNAMVVWSCYEGWGWQNIYVVERN